MEAMKAKPHPRLKGLSDKELIAKYDTGKKVNFDKAIRTMAKTPSSFHHLKKDSGQTH
jgi:hypothetical protein